MVGGSSPNIPYFRVLLTLLVTNYLESFSNMIFRLVIVTAFEGFFEMIINPRSPSHCDFIPHHFYLYQGQKRIWTSYTLRTSTSI